MLLIKRFVSQLTSIEFSLNEFCFKIFTYWEKLFGDLSENTKIQAPPLIAPGSTIKSTQISQCAVGDNTTILEKTSIKNCVFGNNCEVNSKTRISDSVLMNGVVIEEG